MKIEWSEINQQDLIKAVSLMDDNDNPVVEFELYKGYYVADWDTNIKQDEFFRILNKLNCPTDINAVIQSNINYQQKSEIKLKDAFLLNDEISFLSFDSDDYGMTWYIRKDGSKVIEFSSRTKNLSTLTSLLNLTSHGIGDKIKNELDKILNEYKE
jgi:hypothetical protein